MYDFFLLQSQHHQQQKYVLLKSMFFRNACTKSGSLRFSHCSGCLADFVCLYTYEFWLSHCKIVRSSVILLLPLFIDKVTTNYQHGWTASLYEGQSLYDALKNLQAADLTFRYACYVIAFVVFKLNLFTTQFGFDPSIYW